MFHFICDFVSFLWYLHRCVSRAMIRDFDWLIQSLPVVVFFLAMIFGEDTLGMFCLRCTMYMVITYLMTSLIIVRAFLQGKLQYPPPPFSVKDGDQENNKDKDNEQKQEHEKPDVLKQVLVVRTDCNMSVGKAIVEAFSASGGSLDIMRTRNPKLIAKWQDEGECIVCLKVSSLKQFNKIRQQAFDAGIDHNTALDDDSQCVTHYYYEPAPDSATVIAFGPILSSKIDPITRKLSLLKSM